LVYLNNSFGENSPCNCAPQPEVAKNY